MLINDNEDSFTSESDNLVKEYFDLVNLEKSVNTEFSKNISLVSGLMRSRPDNTKVENSLVSTITNLISHLNTFNNDLNQISEEESDYLLEDITKQEGGNLTSTNSLSSQSLSTIVNIDFFNIILNNDINYLVIQELVTNINFGRNFKPITRNKLISSYFIRNDPFKFDKRTISISPEVLQRCQLHLG